MPDEIKRVNAIGPSSALDVTADALPPFDASSAGTEIHSKSEISDTDSTDFSVREKTEVKIGDTVGVYQLVETLGEGGFGTVFLARQTQTLRREVAIKVIKAGMDSSQVVSRFQAERQALALMDHPCIAKVLDAGTTPTGQPYFAMELVRGIAITQYCNKYKLSIPDRLRLFADVCRAIQHAHQKGIIHRDIKPSNILVSAGDTGPKPKVIDFGIAKATMQPLTDSLVRTNMHQVIGTPLYMSPEQAEMGPIDVDTRSDIYSLGVVLHELLVGATPHNLETFQHKSYFDIIKAIRESDLAPPSSKLVQDNKKIVEIAKQRHSDPKSLLRQVRGDLDWITLKCLDKDRTNRYETANALAADIQRHLNNEPVSARRNSFSYTLSKFALRYKGRVLAALLLVLSLAGGLISSVILYQMAEHRAQQVLRLSDINLLNSLEQELPDLLRSDYAVRHDSMLNWLARAKIISTRLPLHQATLNRFEEQLAEIKASSKKDSPKAKLSTVEEQWQYESLQYLVKQFSSFESEDGSIKRMEGFLNRTPSPESIEVAWQKVRSELSIAKGWPPLESIPHLFPFQKNELTGLWEFVDLRAGLVPRIDANGAFPFDEENGTIFVLLPGRTFIMGSPPEEEGRKSNETQHTVSLSPFFISKYELPQKEWIRVMETVQYRGRLGPTLPIITNYMQAIDYCRKMGYSLPTEAQWEYACRAGTTGEFGGTGDLNDMGWFLENANSQIHPVGEKLPNHFGLHDMHGNALEWCFDRIDQYNDHFYETDSAVQLDPVNIPKNWQNGKIDETLAADRCVLRGGPYVGKKSYCRSADRYSALQREDAEMIGLRPTILIVKRTDQSP